jgi:putative tricarboxylic transport membrane protein
MGRAAGGFDKDILAGLALAGRGGFIALRASSWEFIGEDGPGPGFFPLFYGALMLLLSLALTLRALLRAPPRPGPDDSAAPGGHRRALLTWLMFALSAVAMEYTGFVIGFAALAMFIVAYVFRRGWRSAVMVGIGCSAGFWLVFTQLLGVALPAGPLGF